MKIHPSDAGGLPQGLPKDPAGRITAVKVSPTSSSVALWVSDRPKQGRRPESRQRRSPAALRRLTGVPAQPAGGPLQSRPTSDGRPAILVLGGLQSSSYIVCSPRPRVGLHVIAQIDTELVGEPAFRLVVTGTGPVLVTDDGIVTAPLNALAP